MKFNKKIVLAVVAASLIILDGCKFRSRQAKTSTEAANVIVELKNLDDVDPQQISNYLPEIQCEGGPWTPGQLRSSGFSAIFPVKNAHVGQHCDARLSSVSPSNDFVYSSGVGVMFQTSNNFTIASRNNGELWSQALFKRTYSSKPGTQALILPVKFAGNLPSDLNGLIAELKCSPQFEGVSKGLLESDTKNKTGNFRFDSGLKPEVDFDCHQIQVRSSNKDAFLIGDVQQKFSAPKTNDDLTLKQVTIVPVDVIETSGTVIITAPGDACKSNEYFDVETRTCKPT